MPVETAPSATVDVTTGDGRRTPVTFPVHVRDGSAGSAAFPARAAAVADLLPDGLAPVRIAPGTSLAMVAMVDYRDNDLGGYDEIAIAFPCRVEGTGEVGGYIHRLPVTEEFTCAAGTQLWGYPKTVEHLSIDTTGNRARGTWRSDDEFVLQLTVPRRERLRRLPERSMQTFSVLDGRLVATTFTASGRGVRFGPGGRLDLGDHPVAAELRRVLRASRPLWSMWIERVGASFSAPIPVT